MADLDPPIKNYLAVLRQLMDANERAAAIVAGALVENYLGWAIVSRLRGDLSKGAREKIFDDGCLSEFSAKIEIGFALNLYGTTPRADLREVMHIRNQFAHRLDILDFDHQEIAKRCGDLKAPDYLKKIGTMIPVKERTPAKQRFMDTIGYLTNSLSSEAKDHSLPPPPPNCLIY